MYNIGDNPQYRLEIKNSNPKSVWIVLTRHILDKVSISALSPPPKKFGLGKTYNFPTLKF